MGRFLRQYDKDYMKMAMLKQEETFREQVNELHRLYRVQKMMMKEMKSAESKRQQRSAYCQSDLERLNAAKKSSPCKLSYGYQEHSRPWRTLDLERPAEEYAEENGGDIEQESDVELTLGIGRSSRKKEETSDSGASFSSSSTESGGENLKLHEWGLFQMPDMNMSYSSEKNSAFDSGKSMRQDRLKQPAWHFQCLSNMT